MKITRRNLLKRALAFPFVAAASTLPAPAEAEPKPDAPARYLLNRFTIAGFQYYQGPALVLNLAADEEMVYETVLEEKQHGTWEPLVYQGDGLAHIPSIKAGSVFKLVAEPQNPYDEFAVRIDYCGTKIGYVPKSDNRHISRLLQQGARLYCRAIDVNPEAGLWEMVRVEVGMVL